MKNKINVSTPRYDAKTGIAKIILNTDSNNTSEVVIDFKPILPFASSVSSDVVDFFFLTSAIYGIDRFIKRRENSVDGWSRELEVQFPVSNISVWNTMQGKLKELLSFLTGDYWEVEFYQSDFIFDKGPIGEEYEGLFTKVNLFSGGLDSLIGALDHLKSKPDEKILFVSHFDPHMKGPKSDQEYLRDLIKEIYQDQFAFVPSIKVTLADSTLKRESTFRSRSILFIGLALLIAKAKSISEIIIPENGSVSLNYPLSPSRRSACSTRTTHPTVLKLIKTMWDDLGLNMSISNPYEFNTKGEMVHNCKDQENLDKMVSMSNSCGKRGHRAHWDEGTKSASHCAVCMPCLYRRAALLSISDTTTYGNDVDLLCFETKKGQDVGACLEFLKTPLTPKEIREELIINGVKDLSKLDRYIELVLKTRSELKQLILNIGNTTVKKKAGLC